MLEDCGVFHLSSGDLLREEIEASTPETWDDRWMKRRRGVASSFFDYSGSSDAKQHEGSSSQLYFT